MSFYNLFVSVHSIFQQRIIVRQTDAVSLLPLDCFPLFFFSWLVVGTEYAGVISDQTTCGAKIQERRVLRGKKTLGRLIQVNGAFYSIKKSCVMFCITFMRMMMKDMRSQGPWPLSIKTYSVCLWVQSFKNVINKHFFCHSLCKLILHWVTVTLSFDNQSLISSLLSPSGQFSAMPGVIKMSWCS